MYDRRWKERRRLFFGGCERASEIRPFWPPILAFGAATLAEDKAEACFASLASIVVACTALGERKD